MLPDQQWSSGTNAYPIPPSQYNPLDEPSPLGLRLRKSPSLLELIQMKLSQGGASSNGAAQSENFNAVVKKESKGAALSSATDKLKASNFPASLLKIGGWEVSYLLLCYFSLGGWEHRIEKIFLRSFAANILKNLEKFVEFGI